MLCFCGFYFFEGAGGQLYVDVQILMDILKLKSFIFVGFGFFEGVGGQIYVDVKCLMHILVPKSFIFVDFCILKVYKVMCVLMSHV